MFKLFLAFFTTLFALAHATALTYTVTANDNTCFYALADKPGEKMSFYFAVQAGGDFDIDYYVKDPQGLIVLEGTKERQGDFVFTANSVGEYAFCFNNDMSTVTDKVVDFDILVENVPRAELPMKPAATAEQTSGLEESVMKLSSQLSTIARTQKYFRTRENRNMSTVKSTESRIYWFAIMESLAMIAVSGLQVFIVRTFFTRRSSVKV